jgi:hypothetical protein
VLLGGDPEAFKCALKLVVLASHLKLPLAEPARRMASRLKELGEGSPPPPSTKTFVQLFKDELLFSGKVCFVMIFVLNLCDLFFNF